MTPLASGEAEGAAAPVESKASEETSITDDDEGAGSCEKVVARVGRNHGHTLLIHESDILAGVERVYSIRGASTHDHQLQLSSSELSLVARGETLRKKTAFGGGHRHRK